MASTIFRTFMLATTLSLAWGMGIQNRNGVRELSGEFRATGECQCMNMRVVEEINNLKSMFIKTPTTLTLGTDMDDMGNTLWSLQQAWDYLSTKIILADVEIAVPCTGLPTMNATQTLWGHTNRQITIRPAMPYAAPCMLYFELAGQDPTVVPSADIAMVPAIKVTGGANVVITGFTMKEETLNAVLSVAIWVEEGSRVSSRKMMATPGRDLHFEGWFIGVLATNFGIFKGAATGDGKGGIACLNCQTCVVAERLSIVEADGFISQGAFTGIVESVAAISRANSLLVANGATMTGHWTGLMAREGSGIRCSDCAVTREADSLFEMSVNALRVEENAWVDAANLVVNSTSSSAVVGTTGASIYINGASMADIGGPCALSSTGAVVDATKVVCLDAKDTALRAVSGGNLLVGGATVDSPGGWCMESHGGSLISGYSVDSSWAGAVTCLNSLGGMEAGDGSTIILTNATFSNLNDGDATCATASSSSSISAKGTVMCQGLFGTGITSKLGSTTDMMMVTIDNTNSFNPCTDNSQASALNFDEWSPISCSGYTNECTISNSTNLLSMC